MAEQETLSARNHLVHFFHKNKITQTFDIIEIQYSTMFVLHIIVDPQKKYLAFSRFFSQYSIAQAQLLDMYAIYW